MEINTIYSITPIKGEHETYAFGYNGDLVSKSSVDLKRFKSLTMGYPLIMGRKTFESIGSKALPGRPCVVISSMSFDSPHVYSVSSLKDAIDYVKEELHTDKCFVIGGASLIEECNNLYSTGQYVTIFNVEVSKDGIDTTIEFDMENFDVVKEEHTESLSTILNENKLVNITFIDMKNKHLYNIKLK